ncbi:hypothetical protein NIES4075_01530 [Tolypothrix sp. NIES-4075]|nr:hypothetical protein NIES4075_01530 [Tolypothrix sp. NIES-4075]
MKKPIKRALTGYFALVQGGNPHLYYDAWEPPLHTYYPWDWNK